MGVFYTKEEADKSGIDNLFTIRSILEDKTIAYITYDLWVNPVNDDFPEEIERFIEKWREIARNSTLPDYWSWYVKYASIRFLYDDNFYVISPGHLSVNSEMFEHLSNDMEKELKEMGCPFVSYTGMMD